MTEIKSVWQGVYASFDEARAENREQTKTDAFLTQQWIGNSIAKVNELKKTVAGNPSVPSFPMVDEQDVLSFVTSLALKLNPTIRILDFGGGIGCSVVPLLASIPDGSDVEIVIVDNPDVCEQGRTVFSEEPRVSFRDSLPDALEHFDIVHCKSSLQYIEDWHGMLERLSGYQPDYFLVCDLPAGDIPTIVTMQRYYGALIPVRFWNVHDFREKMDDLNYRLLYSAGNVTTVLGVRGVLPMEDLPEENRLAHACNLIYSRVKGT